MEKGKIIIIKDFEIPQLKRTRTLRIYLPPDYDKSEKRYPVFYMNDGQNLYKDSEAAYGASWRVGETLDKLISEGNCREIIVVGIDNGEEKRAIEYALTRREDMVYKGKKFKLPFIIGGEGVEYMEFLVDTLKPYVDKNFRTLANRENTAIGGSSLGGLISIYAGLKYQEVFSKVAAVSTALFFCVEETEAFIKNQKKRECMQIYMDIGTNETSDSSVEVFPEIYVDTNKNLFNFLISEGFKEKLRFEIVEGAVHNEVEWAERFPKIVKWLFGN